MQWCLFILTLMPSASFALNASDVPSKIACKNGDQYRSVKDFNGDCAEMRARDACLKHSEDFDDCIGTRTAKFLKRCSKALAMDWCQICEQKPTGCTGLGKHHRPMHRKKRAS